MTRKIVCFGLLLSVGSLFCAALAPAAWESVKDKAEFPKLQGPYLGQRPPGPTPEVFAPGIISLKNSWEAAVSFSPDLSELFFTFRSAIEGTENRVMHMRRIGNVWTRPQAAPFARNVIEYEAFITPDYQKVIFKSQRPNPAGTVKEGGIWYAPRLNNAWREAEYFPPAVNQGWIMSVTATLDGSLYFTGNSKDGYGIYRSRPLDGEYGRPEYLPAQINQSKYFGASHPCIAPDESYLIFDANAVKNSDLYISFKKADGGWTAAVAFARPINTEGYEGIASVSPDGKYLFFSRDNDIYWADAGMIHALKKELTQ